MSLKNWSPLWSSILDSSVWGESKDVKILWITLLAKKDADGVVASSLPGLARDAVLSIDECKVAMDRLMSPDPYSSTPDREGRRVEKVDSGWRVINAAKYAEEVAIMRRRNSVRENMKTMRQRKAAENSEQSAWNSAHEVRLVKNET